METHFGKVYKSLRTSKRLKLKEIANENLSIGTLSKFENEKNSLTIEKFYTALEAINVTLSEFQSYHELSFETESFSTIKREVVDAYRIGSIAKLKVILDSFNEDKERSYQEKVRNNLYQVVIKACIFTIDNSKIVDETDVNLLYQHLRTTRIWSHFEIWLLSASALIFDDTQLKNLARDFFGRFHFYSADPYTYSVVLLACHNLINAALSREVYEIAFHLLTTVSNIKISETDLEARLFLLYDQGWYDAVTGKREKGLAQMRKVQEIIAFVDVNGNLAEMFRREIEQLVETDFHLYKK
ncbi:MAG: hypothetical protein FWH31_10590 [Streptococcaceae bacterium]|nr:hypothetical protein [Streptococcaceae bacterium]